MTNEIQVYIKKENETIEVPSKQTLYYLNQFKRIDENPRKFTWNWSAALGSCVWLLYRRMYWEAIITIILITVLGEASVYFFGKDLTHPAYLFVLFGLEGNRLYYSHVKRQLKNKKSRGGVDIISSAILFILISIAAALTIYYSGK